MHVLETTDKFRLTTDVAATVDVVATVTDVPTSGSATMDVFAAAITTATTTDFVAAPGTGIRRLKACSIRNKHATLAVTVTVIYDRSGTGYEIHKETLQPGDQLHFTEATAWWRVAASATSILRRSLSADATGTNVSTAQPWFPSTGSATLLAATSYYFTGVLNLTRSAGTTSHTTGLLFGGTATLNSIAWVSHVNTGETAATLPSSITRSIVATNTAVKAASTTATEEISILLHGHVRINAGGTFIPQFIYSAAPGGAPTVRSNSYFFIEPWGSNIATAMGAWS